MSQTTNLRAFLRTATSDAHERLDRAIRAVGSWDDLAGYARFLSLQYAARAPIEAWLAVHAPQHLVPPQQSSLLVADLIMIDEPIPALSETDLCRFEGHNDVDSFVGAAWVLAGSALGNRAILKEILRGGRHDWPHAFLNDERMLQFWQSLRVVIERPATAVNARSARRAALSVFDHFYRHAQRLPELAAA